MQINIVHLRSSFKLGGPEKQIIRVAKNMDPKGFKTIIVSFVQKNGVMNEFLSAAKQNGLETEGILISNSFDPKAITELINILKKYNVKMILAHDYRADVIGYLAAKLTGVTIIGVSRGWTSHTLKVKIYEFIELIVLRHMQKVVAVSDAKLKELVKAGIPERKICKIENTITLSPNLEDRRADFRKELGIKEDEILVGTIGRLSQEKGHKYLIMSAAEVKKTMPNAKFVLVGNGPERKNLENLTQNLKLNQEVIFSGWRDDVGRIYAALDVFVLPSLMEGLPNVLLEAATYKKPIITTNVGGCKEVVQHQQTGLLVKPKDVNELTQALLLLLRDKATRDKLGEDAFNFVASHFSLSKSIEKWEKLYKEVLNIT
jgi:glycosyltransferase involved in cell wall biosynthesis